MAENEAPLVRYAWADTGQIMAVCVCAVSGSSAKDALRMLAASRAAPATLTFAEAQATWAPDATPLQIDSLGGILVLIEPNGYRCSDAEVVRRLSSAGRAVSVYWNVNAVMNFVLAEHGTVVRRFDPLLYEPEGALTEEGGLPFGHPGQPCAAALLLLDRVMQVSISAEWLTGPRRPTYWLDPNASSTG